MSVLKSGEEVALDVEQATSVPGDSWVQMPMHILAIIMLRQVVVVEGFSQRV